MTYNMNLEESVYEKPFQHYELNDPEMYAAARCHANALYDATLAGEHMKLPQAQVVSASLRLPGTSAGGKIIKIQEENHHDNKK